MSDKIREPWLSQVTASEKSVVVGRAATYICAGHALQL